MNPNNIKLSSKKQIDYFWTNHENCELNSENYGGDIELLFCKTHADYHKQNQITRPSGTYIFIDTEKEELTQ